MLESLGKLKTKTESGDRADDFAAALRSEGKVKINLETAGNIPKEEVISGKGKYHKSMISDIWVCASKTANSFFRRFHSLGRNAPFVENQFINDSHSH